MKFFVPLAHGPSQQRRLYEDMRDFLSEELGALLADRKIFRLDYVHDGHEYRAEVGVRHPAGGDMVDAIFFDESTETYYVCTRRHGVVRGHPIPVDAAHIRCETLFED